MQYKVSTEVINELGEVLHPDKDGWVPMDPKSKIICKISFPKHIRTITIHWFEKKTSFVKICRNLYTRKAYDFYFESLYSDTHYCFNHKYRHKYLYRWKK